MSKSGGNSLQALQQFVNKVKTSNIVGKQNELKEIINGPLALAREKARILDTRSLADDNRCKDEAQAVLSKIDLSYKSDLTRNVERIFDEEVERGTIILNDLDPIEENLKSLLETVQQRIQNEMHKQPQLNSDNLSIRFDQYEDARFILVFIRLRSEVLRQYLLVPFNEPSNKIALDLNGDIEEGDFIFRLSKLEVSCIAASP